MRRMRNARNRGRRIDGARSATLSRGMKTYLIAFAAAALAACTPPAAEKAAPPESPAAAVLAEADTATRNALLTALTPVVEKDLGQKVTFKPEIVRTMGDWGWVSAQLVTLDGGAIDFAKTHYAEALKEGMFDGPALNALLRRKDGVWTVADFDIGSTDVAWTAWPQKHAAPPEVMGFETAEGGE
jgi:hypothetical protein